MYFYMFAPSAEYRFYHPLLMLRVITTFPTIKSHAACYALPQLHYSTGTPHYTPTLLPHEYNSHTNSKPGGNPHFLPSPHRPRATGSDFYLAHFRSARADRKRPAPSGSWGRKVQDLTISGHQGAFRRAPPGLHVVRVAPLGLHSLSSTGSGMGFVSSAP